MRLCLILSLLLLAGCTVERNGVVRHVIIGFGIVSVPKTNSVAQVTKLQAIGVYASPGIYGVGWCDALTTSVQTNANVIIEIK